MEIAETKIDFDEWRKEFPSIEKWIFLDHAAVSPLSRFVVEQIGEYLQDMSLNGSSACSKWDRRIESIRLDVGRLLNTSPSEIAFVGNTTHGIGLIAEGFPWRSGDNVVLASEEYPSNQYPWLNLRDRGVSVRRVASRGAKIELEDLFQAIDEKTRVLALSSVQYSSGFSMPLIPLGEYCRSRGIFFAVDAIQSLGAQKIFPNELPIDSLAACGHKWLLGPQGAGIFWLRPKWLDHLHPVGVGWNSVVRPHDFSSIQTEWKNHSGRWEGGTYNFLGIVGLGASISRLLAVGIERIQAKILELTDYLCARLPETNWEVYSCREPSAKSGIVSVTHPSFDPKQITAYCQQIPKSPKSVISPCNDQSGADSSLASLPIAMNVRGGRLRISPHAYNIPAEIDQVIERLKSFPDR